MTPARFRHGNKRLAAIGLLAAAAGGLLATVREPAAADAGSGTRCCAIVELRQYTLHPNRFDDFVELFEGRFIEPLEAAGMTVIGQFRDLDDPDRFVWLRGFRDMPTRAVSLAAFYDGALWKAYRDEANANLTDTDNVLLLHPATADSDVNLGGLERGAIGSGAAGDGGLVVVTVYRLSDNDASAFPGYFEQELKPALARAGITVAAAFETETSPNNFPRLPVREGERVFVWIARFADRRRGDAVLHELTRSAQWREETAAGLQRRLKGAPQVLRLAPTPRSLLRG